VLLLSQQTLDIDPIEEIRSRVASRRVVFLLKNEV
jgi:hypothetical protein